MTETSPAPADNQAKSDDRDAIAPQVPPMTATLMGRLFVVPALVVVSLLAVAVVVILFGASPIDKPRSVAELMNVIESDSGDRSLGNTVLSPKSKQTWQAAQELAIRFEKGHFDGEPIAPMADRLIRLIKDRRANASNTAGDDEDHASGIALQQFLILALSKLNTVNGLEATVGLLSDPDPQIRRIALQAIANMRSLPESVDSLTKMYPLLEDPVAEVRIVAALAIATIAPKGDQTAIDRIAAMTATDRDTQMNRATALARLGSSRGRNMMLNMLSREYWKNLSSTADDANSGWHPLSDDEISDRLIAIAPIAAGLNDAKVIEAVETLSKSDPSPRVRDAALAALSQRSAATSTGTQGNVGSHAGLRVDEPAARGA
ncbi:MAG: HEAT repeat domain-containing protein [Phycisphaerales bacterium]|nr:HEAT repeat domain-containing protein [Phycisphaerales bacterium]MCB9854260.1 HEAT repeat domain-containing protein [Phycisphaerales bacterium]MCB9864732.1 HEAT repeat domain-containing protein [Phycisphaerales bacterium]